MDPGMLHGLIYPPGYPPLFVGAIQSVQAQPKLTAFVTNERCRDTSPRSILELIRRLCGFATAFIIILIGTIASRMAFFLTSTETSLLSWKLNLDTPFAPGSKYGLSMSLSLEEFLGATGNMPPVKWPPIMTQQLCSPNPYTTLPISPHYNPGSSVFTSPGKGY